MTSVTSKVSHLSAASQQILDNISKKGETKLMQKEANITDKMLNSAWEAFGAYVARNLKSGRAITIPGFGVITFGAPFVKLDGVTNPEQRDLRQRIPVFLISKEFVKGLTIQTGICSGGNLRPFSMKGVISGLPQAKINFTDIGSGIGLDKDNTRICIERVIRELADKAKAGKSVDMDIPNLGKFIIKNYLAAIEFQDFLINDTLDATYNFTKIKKYGEVSSGLTFENLRKFVQQQEVIDEKDSLKIEHNAENWLKTNLNIDVNILKCNGPSLFLTPLTSPKAITRPQTAKATSEKNKFAFGSVTSTSDAQSFISRPRSGTSSVRSSVRSTSTFFRITKSSNTNEERTQYLVKQKALKKIKSWLKKSNLQPHEAFNEIARQVFGPNASLKSRLNYAEFKKSLLRLDNINLDLEEIDEIIKTLDAGSSFVITFEQWNILFQAPAGSYVDGIKETIIKKYHLQNPDILKRMNLSQDASEQNLHSLKDALLNLDPTLSESQALKAAKELLGESETISVDQLIKNLGCVSYDLNKEHDWYQTQLILLKRKIRDISKLKQHFEKYDDKNQGLINTTNFKTILQKFKLGFDSEYLYRFTRCVDKDTEMMIDFIKFCEVLENLKIEEELSLLSSNPAYVEFDKFSVINDKLQGYFQSNNIQPKDLVATVFSKEAANLEANDKVSIERFAQFLQKICHNIFPKSQVFLHFTRKIDLDADGFINQNDIETFVARNSYIKQSHLTNQNNLFPKVPLSEAKVEVILRDLRHELNRKKISFYDFARKIDVLQTGFITINDFCKGIDKILKLSQPVKDGFFAYIDTENIGIISYQDFINVLKRSVVDKPVDVTEDSFDWQVEILNMIKGYATEKGLSADDTFRIMDSDFDGFISQGDLLRFLREVLNLTQEEATEPRITRLFKLLDFYKRGCIQLNDIKMLLNSKTNQTNPILSANDWMPKKSPFDWQLHARQQIGLALSQNFSSLKSSFQSIAGNNESMKYTQFHKWIESNRILSGFNMTERLIQKLFADLDPHKKGYLSEIDWFNAFSGYDASQQILLEVQEVIASNYDSIENAYEFFLSIENQIYPSNTQVSYHGFQKALEALLPKRFTTQQITYLWNSCSLDKKSLSLRAFTEKFNNKKFTGSSYLGLSKMGTATFQSSKMTRPYTSTGFSRKTNKSGAEIAAIKEDMQKKLFDKLRQILLASNISVEKFFSSIDVDKSNDISNLEFINAIKSLNLGLNLTEIEDLLLYCDENHDGKINFQEFVRKFAPHLVDHRLFERAKNKLQKFKENIYSYMVSPKDAFLLYNEDRTGKLTYNQFNKLVIRLHQLAREEVPPFSIIKDLFDFLDIRKDGIIDMHEWMQSLSLIDKNLAAQSQPKSNFSQKRSATINVQSLNKTFYASSQPSSVKNATSISEWECSKTYEDILKLIARNRKVLIATFEDLKSQNVAIDPTKIKQVVINLLETHGFSLTNEQWLYLSKFAEKDGQIDYKFMLEVFKERLYLLHAHPKTNVL